MRGRSGCPSGTSTGSCSAASTGAPRPTCWRPRCGSPPDRLPAITARWRRAGYAATGRLGPGPGWCWLTRDGMAATGLGYPADPARAGPAGAHPRASWPPGCGCRPARPGGTGQAWWHSERRLRAEQPAAGRRRARAGRGDPLARPSSALPVRRAGVGDRGRADPQAGRPDHPDHGRAAARPMTLRAGDLPDRPGRPPVVTRAAGVAAARRPGPGRGPGPARVRVHAGAAPVTIWSWLKLTIFLWLLRKAFKLAGWLLLAAVAVAAWPVTLVAAAGYLAAWLRGWPPARLYRTAAWALPVTAVVARPPWRSARPARPSPWPRSGPGPRGWDHLAAPGRRPRVRAAGPGRGPGRAGAGRAAVGVADLRHHHRPGRAHRLGPDRPSTPGSGDAQVRTRARA